MQKNLGATAEEWQWAHATFGKYILPTICGTEHNGVELKGYLKIPSLISKQDGLPKRLAAWNTFEANQKNIKDWSSVPCHGISLRTHEVQAIDIDYEDYDAGYSIAAFFKEQLGDLPTRLSKLHTGRQALLLRVTGIPEGKRLSKRHIYAKDGSSGATELIAQNSQLVIAGTHSSQTCRYTWLDGLPTEIPEVDYHTLKDVWDAAIKLFGTANSTSISAQDVYEVDNTGVDIEQDPFAQYIQSWSGGALFRRFVSNSKMAMRCPWESEHSSIDRDDSTATIYMAANNDKPAQFVCKHAHSRSKNGTLPPAKTLDMVFRRVDYQRTSEDFDHILKVTHKDVKNIEEYGWVRIGKKNLIDPTNAKNISLALTVPEITGGLELAYDEFTASIVDVSKEAWKPVTDIDYTKLETSLAGSSLHIKTSRQKLREYAQAHAHDNTVNSALKYINRLPMWDGEERLDRYATEVLRATPSAYASYVGRYWFVSALTKILHPEEVAEAIIVLQGTQGCGKSAAVKLSALDESLATAGSFRSNADDTVRLLQGASIMEWSELEGKSNHDSEAIKAFITKTEDKLVPKYSNDPVIYKRRCVIIATTNADRFLSDITGARRFFPMRVGITAPMTDFELLEEWRDQLYAEALELVRKDKYTMRKMYRHMNDNLATKYREGLYETSIYNKDVREILNDSELPSITLIDLWSAICNRRGRVANAPNKLEAKGLIFSAQRLGWRLRTANDEDNNSEDVVFDKPRDLF